MKTVRVVTTLLAATGCAVGMTMALADHATATPPAVTGVTDGTRWTGEPSPQDPAATSSVSPLGSHQMHSVDRTHRDEQGSEVHTSVPPSSDSGRCPPGNADCPAHLMPSTPVPSASPQPATHPCLSPAPHTTAPDPPGASSMCGPDGTAGVRSITPPKCTVNATSASQVKSAKPGDTVCLTGNDVAGTQLTITVSGSESSPIMITGDGNTTVKGIRVNANNVIVQGFKVIGAAAPGAQLKGNNITLQDTTIDHPTGGDYDGIRFFGNGIKILHNHVMNITNTHGAHADCLQTFATTTPTIHNILISGNRCEKIDNQCLIAQGPHSRAGNGSGQGESFGLTFSNNYCDAHASQAVHIDDVQNVTMTSNDIQGRVRKAFNFINKSTGAKVSCNKLGPGVGTEVIIDNSSRLDYQGA